MKYAVYAGDRWLFNVHAADESEALKEGQQADPAATRVEAVGDDEEIGRGRM